MGLVRISKASKKASDEAPADYQRAYRRFASTLIDGPTKAKLLHAIKQRKSPAEVAALVPAFNRRDPQGAWGRFYSDLSASYMRTIVEAGQEALAELPGGRRYKLRVTKAVERAPEITVPVNERSLDWIRTRGAEKMVSVSDQQREIVRQIVGSAYKKGRRPEEMVESIYRTVGLTPRQAEAVERRREQVYDETGDRDEADDEATSYAEKQRAYRADMIARTENRDAVEQGRQDAWLSARDEGLLPEATIRRWVAMPVSYRLCEVCEELDGQTTGLDEPFYSDILGEEIMTPSVHPNCRCTVVLEFGKRNE